jgi:hypothetical protein
MCPSHGSRSARVEMDGSQSRIVPRSPVGDDAGFRRAAAWEAACNEFADVCRRNRRAREAAQASLLPPELAAAVDDGERRRGGRAGS